jgi:hypothetical protein
MGKSRASALVDGLALQEMRDTFQVEILHCKEILIRQDYCLRPVIKKMVHEMIDEFEKTNTLRT